MEINDFLSLLDEYWIMITAITGFLYYFYKKEIAKLEKWQNEYFDEILVKFRMKYIKNTSMNIRKFINKIDIYDKEYVPSYLFYLAKQKKYEDIRQILIVDYEHNYPSQRRTSLNSQIKIMNVVGFFLEFVMIFIIVISLLLLFLYLFMSILNHSYIIYFLVVTLFSFCMIFAFITVNFGYTDCYSSKTNVINKIIKQKISAYTKISNKLMY